MMNQRAVVTPTATITPDMDTDDMDMLIPASGTPSMPLSTTTPIVTSTTPVAGAVKEFTVNGSNFKFMPAEIRVKQGDTVRITFKNDGGTHDFRLDEFQVATKVIQGGQQETVEFVADTTGQFEYYCGVGQHRQMGMKGTLIVE